MSRSYERCVEHHPGRVPAAALPDRRRSAAGQPMSGRCDHPTPRARVRVRPTLADRLCPLIFGSNMSDSVFPTILITGATSGIGYSTARQLLIAGAEVLVHGPTASGADDAATRLVAD